VRRHPLLVELAEAAGVFLLEKA